MNDWLISWCFTQFSTVLQFYHDCKLNQHVLPDVLRPVLHTTVFPGNWLHFYIYYLGHWSKKNNGSHSVFFQSSESLNGRAWEVIITIFKAFGVTRPRIEPMSYAP